MSVRYIEQLYQQLPDISDPEFYRLEPEFCSEFYRFQGENMPLCVTAFLTVANWSAASVRSGAWTFYEAARPEDVDMTLKFLEQTGNDPLAGIFRLGIHDYQNPKYAGNCDYPEEWMEEADQIDAWVATHEDWLYGWEKKLLNDNREQICGWIAVETENMV